MSDSIGSCPCADDQSFLRSTTRPPFETGRRSIRVADLFSGCGGLSLGVAAAAHREGLATTIALAVDTDHYAVDAYRRNFPHAVVKVEDVGSLFNGELGARLTTRERALATEIGGLDILVSGAPCQGNSNLNNHTRRRDPRNALYLRAVRAAAVLNPPAVILENVPAIQNDSEGVVQTAVAELQRLDYKVAVGVINLSHLGVPQIRRRHFVVAVAGDLVDPERVFKAPRECSSHMARDVRWAIGDLEGKTTLIGRDAPTSPSTLNQARIKWLFDNDAYDLPNELRPVCHQGSHSYVSMYGRLSWDKPAQTITTGFASMGQGRYVHPSERRTITPHEAARLQAFPDFFSFGEAGRGAMATMIGNAVPPLVATRLGHLILASSQLRRSAVAVRQPETTPSVRVA